MYKNIFSLVYERKVWAIMLFATFFMASLLQGLSLSVIAPMIELSSNSSEPSTNLSRFLAEIFSVISVPLTVSSILFFSFIIIAISSMLSVYSSWIQSQIKFNFDVHQKNRIYQALMKVSPSMMSNLDFGNISYTVQNDARLSSNLLDYFVKNISLLLQAVVYLLLILSVSWQMTLYTIFCGGVVYFCIKRIYRTAKKNGKEIGSLSDQLYSNLNVILNGFASLKVSNAYNKLMNEQNNIHERFKSTSVKLSVVEAALSSIFYPLALLIVISGYHIFDFNVATLFVYVAAVIKLYTCIQSIQNFHYKTVLHYVSIQRVNDLIKKIDAYQLPTVPLKSLIHSASNIIEFNNVTFAYKEGKPVINQLSISIEKNKKIAFVGGSGAGKSTIIDLILGFVLPQGGGINYACQLVSQNGVEQLYDRIGYVPQDAFMINASIKDNILFFRDAEDAEVEVSLRASFSWEFVQELPEGIDTIIGESGAQLSGGQRQRISIARALLKNPEILILDEATSALDNVSEAKIKQAIDHLEDTTIITVAHRLSTIKNYDKIFVIKEGCVNSHGTFDELLVNSSEFSNIYNASISEPH